MPRSHASAIESSPAFTVLVQLTATTSSKAANEIQARSMQARFYLVIVAQTRACIVRSDELARGKLPSILDHHPSPNGRKPDAYESHHCFAYRCAGRCPCGGCPRTGSPQHRAFFGRRFGLGR